MSGINADVHGAAVAAAAQRIAAVAVVRSEKPSGQTAAERVLPAHLRCVTRAGVFPRPVTGR
jgi:hypothetical protein